MTITITSADGNVLVPKRSFRTLSELVYGEVSEEELSQLEKSFRDARNSIGISSAAFGVFLSCGSTVLTIDYEKNPQKWTLLIICAVVGAVVTGIKWVTARSETREFDRILNKIRRLPDATAQVVTKELTQAKPTATVQIKTEDLKTPPG